MKIVNYDDLIGCLLDDSATWIEAGKMDIAAGITLAANVVHSEAFEAELVEEGVWVHDGKEVPNGIDWYHCSECGARESGGYGLTKYCPECGAKMKKGEPKAVVA